jgi:putative Mn2+ efflux pump MntP
MSIVLATFILSVDSFVASLVVGAIGIDRNRQIRMAALFGVCDAAASVIGFACEPATHVPSSIQLPLFRVVLAAYAVIGVLFCSRLKNAQRGTSWWIWALPVVMSLDNLLAPAGRANPGGQAVIVALGSGLMSFAGFRISSGIAASWDTARLRCVKAGVFLLAAGLLLS